jgi:hypothetical protein
MRQNNRWHPCLLPDNYLRKVRQSLSESDDAVLDTHLEPEEEQEDEDARKQVRVAGLTQPSPKLD